MCTSFPDDPVPMCSLPDFHTCTGVENVINFDFPPAPNDYVHRVGRYVIIIIYLAPGFAFFRPHHNFLTIHHNYHAQHCSWV